MDFSTTAEVSAAAIIAEFGRQYGLTLNMAGSKTWESSVTSDWKFTNPKTNGDAKEYILFTGVEWITSNFSQYRCDSTGHILPTISGTVSTWEKQIAGTAGCDANDSPATSVGWLAKAKCSNATFTPGFGVRLYSGVAWCGAAECVTYGHASPDPGGGGGGGSSNKAEPALVRDDGDDTMTIWRWLSNGSAFNRTTDYKSGTFRLGAVGDRVASGDVDGDGKDDIVMAYQNPDGTFSFEVFKNGVSSAGEWYRSGPFNLGPVANRLIMGDFNGDGMDEPILAYDGGTYVVLYRWTSTGSGFGGAPSTATYYNFDLDNVGERVAAGDVDGDGKDDTVMAYQNSDGTFTYKVFRSGTIAPTNWYTSGGFSLAPVAGRLVVGDFAGDGKEEPALVREVGTDSMKIWRWTSNGSSFSRTTDYQAGTFRLSAVADRVASGDTDGDGKDDVVMAYENPDGTFSYEVFQGGISSAGEMYRSGTFSLSPVSNRLVVGRFN
ncbi:hypothetical protein F4553_001444 [Allocatelliglobosispora scoriae]|uniref:VCBS repeat-containing protein n=1 Tax=Allocatelliglobosispora scoriae TaxID=643052 RepID=A0A841BK97_9ACTN|nr:FG-GAP-like repeat-containing protein [Allocatelliglobosispora scoriae]MBB5868065.1 hypothetical protein [Allocatelliglobosispora scoriae]